MNNNNREHLTDKYFRGALSAGEREEFYRILEADADFAETIQFEKEVRDSLVMQERRGIKERFRLLDQGQAPKRFSPTFWYIAASLVLLIAAAWIIVDRRSGDLNVRLFAEYMEPYPNVLSPRVRGGESGDIRVKIAMEQYDLGNFYEAVALFNDISEEGRGDLITMYLAISYLMVDEPKQAISLLEKIQINSPQISSAVVDWYLGLAYLRDDQIKFAKMRFLKVKESGGDLSVLAGELNEKLGD